MTITKDDPTKITNDYMIVTYIYMLACHDYAISHYRNNNY